jgi:hypothetical protein
VGGPSSGVDRCVCAPDPRAFASLLLPLGAFPGPRRRGASTYRHSPPRLLHVLHFGLSPLQPSFLPDGWRLRQQRGNKNGPTMTFTISHKRLRLLVNFIQGHVPLQKLHAISVFFLNLRKGCDTPSGEPLTLCFPLFAILMGLSSTRSPCPASEEEPSIAVDGPGTSRKTESSCGLTKLSTLESPGSA